MNTAKNAALIINTYEQPDYLARVLAAVARQSRAPDEVVLADDGSGGATRKLFAAWSAGKSFHSEHVWQKQVGFRRARILNEAIAAVKSEYVLFLDGDTVPHGHFVADHLALAARGRFVQGHRALVGQRAAADFAKDGRARSRLGALCTGQMSGAANVFRWPFAVKRRREDLRGIRGCNLAIWRDDLVRVNGYNEAFTGWGREDAELAARLMNSGVYRVDARGWALCYHLWHPPADRSGLAVNDSLLAAVVQERRQWCESGLDGHLKARSA
jgi:glycosyltransferase involved in cell wall biosynthesis